MEGLLLNGSVKQKTFNSSRNTWIATICACMNALSLGYILGYSSPVIPEMTKKNILTEHESSWFGSLITIGALVGGILGGCTVERYGRKRTIIYSNIPQIIGWIMICSSSSVWSLYAGRFLTGLAGGQAIIGVPIYIAEIATKDIRGMLGSGVQLAITIGILLVYALGLVLSWTILAVFGLFLPVIGCAAMVFMPETPRYLLMRTQRSEAMKALVFFRGRDADVEEERRDIEESFDPAEKFSWSEFRKPELLQPLKVALLLMFFQQISGINVVIFYTGSIFKDAGYKETALATVIIGAVQVVMTLLASLLMDRFGRRLLLLTSSISMSMACGTLGWYYYQTSTSAPGTASSDISWLALTSLVVYIIGFSLGWGPIPMLMTSEIFPSQARGKASAMAICLNWTCAFIVAKEFGSLQYVLGKAGAFWFYQFWILCSIFFVWKMVPETKGKSLEDIELYFMGRAIHGRGVRGV